MIRGLQGRYIIHRTKPEPFNAFVPRPLPPDPPVEIAGKLRDALDRANLALGRLDGVASILPDIGYLLYLYIRKEAVLSSQVEGTQSSLSDLLMYENSAAPGVPLDDVTEVSHYVAALQLGLDRIRSGAPLTGRLLREIHAVLLAQGRGSDKRPGEFRQSQNWLGGTRPGNAVFVPPPPDELMDCIGALEKFLHDMPTRTPTLVKAALAHVQFETIHPFLDGNGRLGRMLITLLLCYEEVLREPLLYLSLHFKTHRSLYYDLLQRTRTEGDWEGWLLFFLEGVREVADQAAGAAQRVLHLFEADRQRVEQSRRPTASAMRVLHLLERRLLVSIPGAARELEMSQPTITAALHALAEMGIVRQIGERRRNRIFCYDAYLSILNEGTEPIPP